MVHPQTLQPRLPLNSAPGAPPPPAVAPPQAGAVQPTASAPVASQLSFPVCRADGQPFTTLAELEALMASEPAG